MNVLILGSGGREHALAWKAAQSPRATQLYVAPGNAGTAALAQNVPVRADDQPALVAFAREHDIHLVIVGPEAPLANGVTDSLSAAGVKVFGPTRAAAQIEASKPFAKDFMARHGIATARYQTFDDFYDALAHLLAVDYPVVVKAAGLAAGKGVIVPSCEDEAEAALRRIMLDKEFGGAGDQVVIEERLEGEEVSLMAFSDGRSVKVMPAAQDHKRLLDGDRGPNTGGMGAYAPAPLMSPALVEQCTRDVLQRAIDGLRAEGRPFSGVLYAGLMLTQDGPRVLEFNGRFGDPETQVVLPLLDSDLLDVCEACADGRLNEVDVRWQPRASACVVLASEGYPDKPISGRPINGLDRRDDHSIVFHAGTRCEQDKIVSAGGRVLAVTGWGDRLPVALDRAYQAVQRVSFEGMQYRRDIGARMTVNGLDNGQTDRKRTEWR